jgi:hypothetical protein
VGSEAASSQLHKVLRDLPQHQSIAPGNERRRCTQLSSGDCRGGGVVVTVIQAAEVPNQRLRQHHDHEGTNDERSMLLQHSVRARPSLANLTTSLQHFQDKIVHLLLVGAKTPRGP